MRRLQQHVGFVPIGDIVTPARRRGARQQGIEALQQQGRFLAE